MFMGISSERLRIFSHKSLYDGACYSSRRSPGLNLQASLVDTPFKSEDLVLNFLTCVLLIYLFRGGWLLFFFSFSFLFF